MLAPDLAHPSGAERRDETMASDREPSSRRSSSISITLPRAAMIARSSRCGPGCCRARDTPRAAPSMRETPVTVFPIAGRAGAQCGRSPECPRRSASAGTAIRAHRGGTAIGRPLWHRESYRDVDDDPHRTPTVSARRSRWRISQRRWNSVGSSCTASRNSVRPRQTPNLASRCSSGRRRGPHRCAGRWRYATDSSRR